MTTPSGSGVGGLIGNLLGGASGSLGGTNVLQQSIDQLTNAVNSLSGNISSSNFGAGSVGQATRQQGSNAGGTQRFPSMVNPFQASAQQPGIGGGGAGGSGNVSTPMPFGRSGLATMASAVTAFGQQQMNPLLTLNQYATSSMMGYNFNGMSKGQAMQQLYSQVGATPNSLNSLASSAQDAYGMAAPLQMLGGTQNINQSSLGRAGRGAAAGFGITNPTLGATSSAQLAAALYSPQFSQNMMMMGYQPIRSMSGGAPMNSGQAAQSILQRLGLNGKSPSSVYGNLSSGRGQASLSALFGSSGISNTQAATFLQGYDQLFSKGLNPTQASNLMQQAAFGSASQMKSAQNRLSSLGVTTANNDIQALKTSQSVVSGREGTYAGGFNSAIQDSTGLLEQFNGALTKLLSSTGLGTALGYGGGFGGVLSGTSHAVGSLGTLGGLMSVGKLLGKLGGSAGKDASSAAGDAMRFAKGSDGVWSRAGSTLGDAGSFLGKAGAGTEALAMLAPFLTSGGRSNMAASARSNQVQGGLWNPVNDLNGYFHSLLNTMSFGTLAKTAHPASIGGGAASMASTTQQKTGGNNQMGSVSGASKKAVGAAESQLGVPYVYGDEQPGVGFDCCYRGTEYVQTISGPKQIKDITTSDTVYSYTADGIEQNKVIKSQFTKTQQTFRMETRRRSVVASANHPFARINYGLNKTPSIEWVALENLRRGDRIVILDHLPDKGESLYNDDYLWILGAMLGDGHLSKSHSGRVNLCMFGCQREEAISILGRLTANKITEHPSHGIYFSDIKLFNLLKSHGLDKKSFEKQVPGFIWLLPHAQIRVFLDGYATADGSVSRRVQSYHSTSIELVRQIRNLHIILGDPVSQVHVQQRTKPVIINNKEVKHARPLYNFSVSSKHNNSFLSARPNVRKLIPENFAAERILSIEAECVEDTYDIEIENAHNFIAEGVVTHNSALVQWAYKQAGVNLPRTSQTQWAALKNKRVSKTAVQEGDLVFAAGSDGTSASPGHVGMMINNRQLIQAPYTGANVQIVGYDPNAWVYAARPSGQGSFLAGGTASSAASASGAPGNIGNRGLSLGSGGGSYGSVNEADVINAMGSGGGGGSFVGSGGNGSSGSSSTISGGSTKNMKIPKSAGNAASIARGLAQQYGWASGSQWQDFLSVVNKEDASWNPRATNPKSGAYGIPQALPGDKMASAGPDWQSSAATQLKWMFGYIKNKYGTPSGALAHENQLGWYGAGGQLSVVGDRGPELMMQTPGGGAQVFSNAQTMAFINSIKGNTAQSPWKTDITSGGSPQQSGSRPISINFNQGSIVVQSQGSDGSIASRAGREVVREIIKQLSNESVSSAIRAGDKL